MHEDKKQHKYTVVLNDEGQHSIWLSADPLPNGWRHNGTGGSKDFCLDEIERVWTDVYPVSVRSRSAQKEHPEFVPVHQMVASRALKEPDALAVTDRWTSLTYRQLIDRSDKLACALIEKGLTRGDIVAVHMQRSAALTVSLLAISRAGGASLMLDWEGPKQWLSGFIDAAKPSAWLTHSDGAAAPSFTGAVHRLDTTGRTRAGEVNTVEFPDVHPEDPACLVQTSGSTGLPKLVVVPHRTWSHATVTQQDLHQIGRTERGCWLFPAHTNVSVSVVIWPFLAAGAHLSIADSELVASPDKLAVWIRNERITQLFAVAPLAEALAKLDWPPSDLRMMLTGSDRVREWGRRELPFEIGNWYGANEVNIVTSSLIPWSKRITSATASEADRAGLVPIGSVWPGASWRVVDTNHYPVEPGEVGELLVGGQQIALGYLSTRSTAEKFLPDAHGEQPGARIYCTGDLVRIRPDGTLEHCGRIDEQVKINGLRVELAEVERAMLGCPTVEDAAVAAVRTPSGRDQLIGYLVSDSPITNIELRRALSDVLPPHMVPVAFVRLNELPRNRGDKIDRLALPYPGTTEIDGGDSVDEMVASVLSDVLDIGTCTIDENFFLLGGDSLLAATAARQLTLESGHLVSVRDVLDNPTARELGRLIRGATTETPTA